MGMIGVTLSYPRSEEYEYETVMKRLNLDEERKKDISTDNGFIIGSPHGIKKDLKDPNGLWSSKFGQTLRDINPYANRYRCKCGHLNFRINNKTICPICNTPVEYVDDNFSYFGWIVLKDPHVVIHPNMYKLINTFLGKDILDHIICYKDEKDADGHVVDTGAYRTKDEPWHSIGMMGFKEHFDEIMEFYSRNLTNKRKIDQYNEIMANKDVIFTQSIPVFTSLLRPIDIDQKSLYYEDTNALYNMMNKIADQLNKYGDLMMNRKSTSNFKLLYDLQEKWNKLYRNIEDILQKKKGIVRSLLGGRYNFSSRCVIAANLSVRVDEVKLPYKCLVKLLEQRIVNIIQKTYNKSYSDAYNIWYKSFIEETPMVREIIESLIAHDHSGRGIPILINRNPTIAYGGILQVFCVGISDSFVMGIPLQILPSLAADFDGDVLNILLITNDDFYQRAFEVFNPRNAMYISRNDAKFNTAMSHQKDTIISAHTMMRIGRENYTEEELAAIKRIKEINRMKRMAS